MCEHERNRLYILHLNGLLDKKSEVSSEKWSIIMCVHMTFCYSMQSRSSIFLCSVMWKVGRCMRNKATCTICIWLITSNTSLQGSTDQLQDKPQFKSKRQAEMLRGQLYKKEKSTVQAQAQAKEQLRDKITPSLLISSLYVNAQKSILKRNPSVSSGCSDH